MEYDFFNVFLPLHDSLKNDVSEHLEWLKFQKFSGVSAPKPPQREVTQCPSVPPVVSRTAYENKVPLN